MVDDLLGDLLVGACQVDLNDDAIPPGHIAI
jgi:hypothetical protein